MERLSCEWMLKTLFARLMLTFAAFVIGSTAEYEQSVGMYLVFTIICIILGILLFVGHCMCDNLVRNLLILR